VRQKMIDCPIGSKRTHVKISKDKGAHYRLANGEVKTMFHLKAKMIHFLHLAVNLTPIPPSRSIFPPPTGRKMRTDLTKM